MKHILYMFSVCVCVCVSCCNSYCNYSRGLMWINYSLQLMFHEGICLHALDQQIDAISCHINTTYMYDIACALCVVNHFSSVRFVCVCNLLLICSLLHVCVIIIIAVIHLSVSLSLSLPYYSLYSSFILPCPPPPPQLVFWSH